VIIKKLKERKLAAAADQRQLCAKTFIADIAAEVDRRETCSGSWVTNEQVHPFLAGI
jgi:hypothetical protein